MSLKPVTTDPVATTSGTAGYGNQGIEASAASSANKGPGGHGGYYSGPVYTYEPIPGNVVPAYDPSIYIQNGFIQKPMGTLPTQPACPPGQTGYYVWDSTGQLVATICVPDTTTSTGVPAGPVGALVQQASSQQPWPNLVVGSNPTNGLAGLQSWFWLGGGVATIPQASATAGPLSVRVQATLTDIVWDFGDGIQYDSGSSLGAAYPQQSDISHIYQADSYGLSGGFVVSVSLRFAVTYSVNGGPWTALGTKARTYSRPYTVNQAQPEGVSSQ
ncbi:MAG: hypothetical protein ACYDGR_01930 [Candidatus Dormibacteria bacterium]